MRRLVAVAVGVLALLTAPHADAAWATAGSGTSVVTSTTVNKAATPTATRTGSTVTLAWAKSTLATNQAVSGYDVVRHSGATTTVVCSGTDPTRTCQDASPLATVVSYGVVARKGTTWRGPESTLTTYTPPAPGPPVTSYSQSPAANAAGWNNAAVAVTLTATDGDGVANVRYRLNGGTTVVTSGSSATFNVSASGTTTVTYWSVDVLGNVETQSTQSVRIDTAAPTSTVTPASSATVWRTSSQVTINGSDALSGVAQIVYAVDGGAEQTVNAATATLTLADGTHALSYRAVDAAGNTHVSNAATFKIDASAPTLTALLPANGSSYTNNNNGSGSWSRVCTSGRVCVNVADLTSGVDPSTLTFTLVRQSSCWNGTAFVAGTSCTAPLTYTVATGQAASTAIPLAQMLDGTYTLTVTAKDLAGNVSTASATFTIT